MTISTYATLKAAIINYSKRDDLSNELDTFIDIAEARLNADLRIRENEERATATMSASSRFLALPTGFLQMRRIDLISGSNTYQLQFITPDAMQVRNAAGRPAEFTVTSQLEFDRTPDSAYTLEMSYYRGVTALSSSNTTNDILTKYPMLYLYACVAEAHRFGRDEDSANIYDNFYEAALVKAIRTDRRGRVGPGARMRTQGSTP